MTALAPIPAPAVTPPSAADLLDRLLADAEAVRSGVDQLLAALNDGVCPTCEGPLEDRRDDAACMRCDWRWTL